MKSNAIGTDKNIDVHMDELISPETAAQNFSNIIEDYLRDNKLERETVYKVAIHFLKKEFSES